MKCGLCNTRNPPPMIGYSPDCFSRTSSQAMISTAGIGKVRLARSRWEGDNVNPADLRARVQRLNKLVIGLGRECSLVQAGNDPLHRTERRDYLEALDGAARLLEIARLVLAGPLRRMEQERHQLRAGLPTYYVCRPTATLPRSRREQTNVKISKSCAPLVSRLTVSHSPRSAAPIVNRQGGQRHRNAAGSTSRKAADQLSVPRVLLTFC
jgi:hypothetical protein